jgi:hypothetical protein
MNRQCWILSSFLYWSFDNVGSSPSFFNQSFDNVGSSPSLFNQSFDNVGSSPSFFYQSFNNVGSSPSLTDHLTISVPVLHFFLRKELRTKTIFHIVIYTSIDWVMIGEFLRLNQWINNIVKTIFLQTIIRLYLLMVLTDNSICRSSDLLFKRQTDNTVSKANR